LSPRLLKVFSISSPLISGILNVFPWDVFELPAFLLGVTLAAAGAVSASSV